MLATDSPQSILAALSVLDRVSGKPAPKSAIKEGIVAKIPAKPAPSSYQRLKQVETGLAMLYEVLSEAAVHRGLPMNVKADVFDHFDGLRNALRKGLTTMESASS